MQVGELSVNITANTSQFSSDLNGVQTMGNNFSSNFSNGIQTTLTGAFGKVGTVGTAAFQTISGVASTVKNTLVTVGTSLTQNVTLPLGAASLAALKLGADFESSLSKVTGLVGVASNQVDEWGKEILDLAPELGIAPTELADALFYVTSAGLRGAEAMDVLEMSGKAASSGLGEAKTIADLVTSAMNAYGSENLSASQATDILTAAVKEGKAEASELASSMGQVLPIASEMGVSFDQVAASQAAMTKTGTSASEASTQLKSILSGLLKPSQQAEEALEGMGTSSAELRKSIKEKGLMSTLGDLRKLTNKYGEDAMAKVFPNIRALSGVLDLMGSNASDNVEVFDAVKNSTGSLDDAFAAASETLDFKWNQALSQVQSTALSFFEVLKGVALPILETLISVLDWVGEKFTNLSPKMQQFFILFGIAAAAIGPIILAVVTVITTLVTIFGGLLVTLAAGIGIWAMFAPIIVTVGAVMTALIAIVAGLVASFIHLWKTNDEFRENVLQTWEYLKEKGKEIFNNLKEIVKVVLEKIKTFWQNHGDKIMSIAEKAWNLILTIIKTGANFISNVVKLVLAVIKGDWSGAWSAMKSILKSAWAVIKNLFKAGMNASYAIMVALKNKVGDAFKAMVNKAKSNAKLLKNALKAGIDAALQLIKNKYSVFKNAGAKLCSMIASGIKSAVGKVTGAVSDLAGSIRNFLPFSPAKEGPLSDLDKLNFYDSIEKSLNSAKNKLSVPVTAVAEKIAGGLVTDISSTLGNTGETTNNKSMNISAINIYGASDTYTMLQELQSTLKRYSGRLK
jgi:TP901 family phage tail tape measure protein